MLETGGGDRAMPQRRAGRWEERAVKHRAVHCTMYTATHELLDFELGRHAMEKLVELVAAHQQELHHLIDSQREALRTILEEVNFAPQPPDDGEGITMALEDAQRPMQPTLPEDVDPLPSSPLEIWSEKIEIPEFEAHHVETGSNGSEPFDLSTCVEDAQIRSERPSGVVSSHMLGVGADTSTKQKMLYRLDCLAGLCVLLNSLFMTVELELEGRMSGALLGRTPPMDLDSATFFNVTDNIFAVLYFLELVCRVAIEKKKFFQTAVNWFDIFLATTTCLDVWLLRPMALSGGATDQMILLRLARAVKSMRAIRMVRTLRLFRGLRVLVRACYSFLPSLAWSMVLLAIFMIMGALMLGNLLQEFIADTSQDAESRDWIWEHYGTALRAMYTLYEITFAGNWPTYARPVIRDVGSYFALFFLAYITLIVFAVIRVITAIFLKDTLDAANNDAELLVVERLQKKASYVKKLETIFQSIREANGMISQARLEETLEDPKVKAYFQTLEVDVHEGTALFHILDNGDGEVTLEEFIDGILRCKGPARAIDQVAMQAEMRQMSAKLEDATELLERAFGNKPPPRLFRRGSRAEYMRLFRPSLKEGHTFSQVGSTLVQQISLLEEESPFKLKGDWVPAPAAILLVDAVPRPAARARFLRMWRFCAVERLAVAQLFLNLFAKFASSWELDWPSELTRESSDDPGFYEVSTISRSSELQPERQALLVHPDKGGDATSFQAVARAYEVLSDPISRDEYHMSLLELGRQDGLENVEDLFIGSKVHMLADFPQDLIQVLLASPRRGWRQLLRDLRSEQLGRLLGALAELPHNCKKKQKSGREQAGERWSECSQEVAGTKYLSSNSSLASMEAQINLCGLEVRTPATTLKPVIAFYHTAVVELRACLRCLRAKPDATLDTGLMALNEYACRFDVRFRRRIKGVQAAPMVDEAHVALQMRRELQGMSTLAKYKALKKTWSQMLQDTLPERQARRREKAHELKGYILALSDASVPHLPFRRKSKQPADVTLKVPLLGKLAVALGGQTQLEKKLATPAGQKALLQFFSTTSSLALPPPGLGWKQMQAEQKASVFEFTAMVDLARFAATHKAASHEVQECMDIRGCNELRLHRHDFSADTVWQLPQLLSFFHAKLGCTQVLCCGPRWVHSRG
ncbi:unnamed protein product [Effrenium voratum]|nr:unnamed protein product [Effrenium voratum]